MSEVEAAADADLADRYRYYNAPKLHDELLAAGLPIIGCNSKGVINWGDGVQPSPEDVKKAKEVCAAHDPALTLTQQITTALFGFDRQILASKILRDDPDAWKQLTDEQQKIIEQALAKAAGDMVKKLSG